LRNDSQIRTGFCGGDTTIGKHSIEESYRPSVQPHAFRDRSNEGCFSGTIWTEQSQPFAPSQPHRSALQRLRLSEALRRTFDL
jgi:hypothetical protein